MFAIPVNTSLSEKIAIIGSFGLASAILAV